MTQTLYSTVVKLTATQSGTLPVTNGDLAHGAFFNILKSVDPALSGAIHAIQSRKPFTISPLQDLPRPHKGRISIKQGQVTWLRFTLLDPQLFAALTQYLLSSTQRWPTIRLGNLNFTITEMLTTPGSHPWAGYTTTTMLQEKCHPDATGGKISLEFASGMMFSRNSNKNGMGKFQEYLPIPAMVFGSLAAMWNDHTGLMLDKKAVREYAKETVVVSAYKMETRLFHYSRNPQIGAIGRVTYQLKDKNNQAMIQILNMLADFAFYSGIGAKTAMGLGQVRRVVG